MTSRVYSVTEKEEKRLERDESFSHHIPGALIDKLASLSHLRYADLLRNFGSEYADAKFGEIDEEYEFIKGKICQLLNFCFSQPFTEVVEKGMLAAIAEANFEGAAREKFIHPFQNFLLGSVILDNYYAEFRKWFSDKLCNSIETSIESSWMLASVFHDRLKPLQSLKGLIEFEEGRVETVVANESAYVNAMQSLYDHLSSGRPLEEWSPSSNSRSSQLHDILIDYCEADNHGVKSSFALLKHLEAVFQEEAFGASYMEAALAIAVHDHDLHNPLIADHIFPLDITLFPIPCLLIYCDTIQEWGRRRTYNQDTRLVNVSFDSSTICCEVAFESNEAARRKLAEISATMGCIQSRGLIEFTFSPRVCVSV